MFPNALASELVAVADGSIDPDAYTVQTLTTGWVDMADFESVLAIVQAGDLGSSATLDAKLRQATSSAGTGAKDITGKAITQLTQAGTDSNKQALINCRREELDLDNEFRYVQLSMTIAVATSDAAGMILGVNPRRGPASDNDISTVDEIVA